MLWFIITIEWLQRVFPPEDKTRISSGLVRSDLQDVWGRHGFRQRNWWQASFPGFAPSWHVSSQISILYLIHSLLWDPDCPTTAASTALCCSTTCWIGTHMVFKGDRMQRKGEGQGGNCGPSPGLASSLRAMTEGQSGLLWERWAEGRDQKAAAW